MTIPNAAEILQLLQQAKPQPTSAAPRDAQGIYGLFDHTGVFRYIGSTSSDAETFYKRIHQRHRTGSESHSHYFARMYNTGRMWVDRKDPDTIAEMKIVRRLRQAFIAQHCGCTWVALPDHANIAGLEAEVIALAPAEMVAWNRRGMAAYEEPVALVDEMIELLGFRPYERAALGRQRDRSLAGQCIARKAPARLAADLPPLPEGPFRFFALDVETANHDRSSICQVGVACVRPDDSIETWVTLVDPRTQVWMFSDLHGITKEMVAGAPTVGDVIDALDRLLPGHLVYQHSGFDRSALRAACDRIGRAEPLWDWRDSVTVARRAWPELKGSGGHGLASLKAHLGLRFEHHDAGEDARAAAEVVLLAERGASIVDKSRSEIVVDDVIDHDDVGPAFGSSSSVAVPHSKLPAAVIEKSHSIGLNFAVQTSLSASLGMIRVPVAADGSTFGPDLARRGRYTVGAKGDEKQFNTFDAALAALHQMDTPRWRRPNTAGNWGIVSGCSWKKIEGR